MARRSVRGRRRILRHPCFPLTFLARNLALLVREDRTPVPVRLKKAYLAGVVCQRAGWFAHLMKELNGRTGDAQGTPSGAPSGREREDIESYCDHCGLCCEIAGGYPDFAGNPPLPEVWQKLFRDGLGPGHRFCPFLLEDRTRGRSGCAVHPRRPNPCRIFEADECRALKDDVEAERASDRALRPMARRAVSRLLL